MDISDVSSSYSDYLASSAGAASKISSLSSKDYSGASDEEMMSACKEFEEYLVEMVMKEVTKTVDIFGDGEESNGTLSTQEDLLKDQMVREMATKVTDTGDLGIAQKLYESMKRNV